MTRFWSLAAFPQSSDEYYQKQAFTVTTWLMSAIDFATTILQLALTCVERKELLMHAKQFANLRRRCVFRRFGCWDSDRLGEPNPVRADIAGDYRDDCCAVGDVVEANKPGHALASIDGAGGYSYDYNHIALAGVPLGASHRDARPRCARGLSVRWFRVGTCLPHRSTIGSRRFQLCRERCFGREHLGQL
jgi:hypothetical protein